MKTYIKTITRLKKRHFQLLEIMVAIFLLLVCAAPMLHIYTYLLKEQQAIVRSYQQDHWVHLVHAKITEQLYKRQIPLEDILQGKSDIRIDEDLKKVLDPLGYGCTYAFSVLEPTTDRGKKMACHYLCSMAITMKDLLEKPSKKKIEDTKNEPKEPPTYYFYIGTDKKDNKQAGSPPEETEQKLDPDLLDGSE